MDLFLIRHAEAEPQSPDGSDEGRGLTKKGRRHFESEVEGLARLGIRFDRLLFSPLLRAQETADCALDLCDGESQVMRELAEPPNDRLLEAIGGGEYPRTGLVGHEPWLSQLATRLVVSKHGDEEQSMSVLHIEKGGVVHLSGEVTEGGMSLVAAYPPDVLRKLARR
jgi:phosphohistidine phosphatase